MGLLFSLETQIMKRIVALLLMVACTACGLNPPPKPPPAQPRSTLAVVTVDSQRVAPIEGATVAVHTGETGLTNADGYIAFHNLGHGERGISVTAEGYAPAFAAVMEFVQNTQVVIQLTSNTPPPVIIPPPVDPPVTPPSPVTPIRNSSPIVGQLRIGENCFVDDTGCVLPLYAHAGDLFSLYTRDPVRVQNQLNTIAATGYHGIRTWATLGCGKPTTCAASDYWVGREVGPDVTPDYWLQVERFLNELRARDLRVVWSQGDVGQLKDRQGYMGAFARLDLAGSPVVDWLDCGNEAWQTGEPDASALARCVGYYRAAGGRALLTLTSPPGENKEELDAYSIPPADAYDVHSYRGGHSWDKRRHIFSIPYEGKPEKRFGINSEPPGGGALVSASENKHELDDEAVALLGVAAAYSRQAWVWFSGQGVKLGTGLEHDPGFYSTPRLMGYLPRDIMTFSTLHHSGASWSRNRVLEPLGEIRIDGRQSNDGRFVYTIDGPSGTYDLRVAQAFSGRICDTINAMCTPIDRNAGDVLSLTFVRGRVLIGRLK